MQLNSVVLHSTGDSLKSDTYIYLTLIYIAINENTEIYDSLFLCLRILVILCLFFLCLCMWNFIIYPYPL